MLDDRSGVWTQRGMLVLALVTQLGLGIIMFARMDQRLTVLEKQEAVEDIRWTDHIGRVTTDVLDRLARVEERQQNVLRVLGRVEIMLQGHMLEPSKMYPRIPAIEDRPEGGK